MAQTSIQQSSKIQFGSGKFEISEDGESWTNLGAMRNIVFTEEWEEVRVMSDNAGEVKRSIKNHYASLAGDLMELDLGNLNTIRGGIDSYSTDAGVSETLKSGGLKTITAIQVRVTNTNEDGEDFKITIYKGYNNKGIEITLNPDDADDPNMINVEIQGCCDTTLDEGEQLFEIYNEQGESAAS